MKGLLCVVVVLVAVVSLAACGVAVRIGGGQLGVDLEPAVSKSDTGCKEPNK